MKIFCWVKQIIKRFIYEKTIRPFNTSDYHGSAMGRGKREIRRSASPQWTLFGREIYWGASVFWITHWKHWFGITSLQQQRPLALVVKRKIMGRGMDSGATLLVLKFCDLLWALGQVTWPLVAWFYISRVSIIVVPS